MSRDDRSERRGRDEDRGREDRGSRDRGRDRDSDRGSRDDRGRDSGREASSRGRDRDDRGSRDAGRGSGSSSRFQYQARSEEDRQKRATQSANDFDKILKDGVKMFKPNDGTNRIRILPPTWEGARHYGHDIYVHYGVGPDRQSYLCLNKMKGDPDPISEAREEARRDNDEKLAKELDAKKRVLIYLIDRDHEKEGVQAWAMPWTVDRDITTVSKDRSTGEVYNVDDPEEGYDIEFDKRGSKDRTEYTGIAVARRSTPLGRAEWLDYAMDNPLPEQLNFYDYDYIAKLFNGGGAQRDRDGGRDRDEDRDFSGRRDRDDRDSRSRDDDRGNRDRDRDDRGSSRGRDDPPAKEKELTWAGIHDMTFSELEDLVDDEKLHDVNPAEAKDADDLADWICEELGIKEPVKEERRERSRVNADKDEGGSSADRLRRMREGR